MNFKKKKTLKQTMMHCQSSVFELVPSCFWRIKIFLLVVFNILELWYYVKLLSKLLHYGEGNIL